MPPISFSFGNAISHYSKTGGPAGFLWKFALAYTLIACVLQALSVWVQWPVYEVYIRIFTEGGDIESHARELEQASNSTMLQGLLLAPLGLFVWLMFEGANQRRYMRGEGFGLRIGADEGRIFVVGLMWIAFFIGAYIGLVFAILIPVFIGLAMGESGIALAILLGVLMFFGYMLLVLWLAARLSAAASLTVRDRRIRFFESWRITRGKGWTILGAWIVLLLIIMVAYVVLYLVAIALGFGLIAAQVPDFADGRIDDAAILAAVASPAFWVPMLLVGLVLFGVQAMFQHIFSGPAALAARTDPDWSGADVAGEFV